MYEMKAERREEFNDLIARLEVQTLEEVPDEDVIELPPFIVWACNRDGSLGSVLLAVWTWKEAIRCAKAAAIVGGFVTRVTVIA